MQESSATPSIRSFFSLSLSRIETHESTSHRRPLTRGRWSLSLDRQWILHGAQSLQSGLVLAQTILPFASQMGAVIVGKTGADVKSSPSEPQKPRQSASDGQVQACTRHFNDTSKLDPCRECWVSRGLSQSLFARLAHIMRHAPPSIRNAYDRAIRSASNADLTGRQAATFTQQSSATVAGGRGCFSI